MIKKNNSLAQGAMEFTILIGFILLFFTVFFLVINGNISDKMRERNDLIMKDLALAVQDEINLAFISIEGYSRTFVIPEKLFNKDYSISIIDELVYIVTDDEKYAVSLPVAPVIGQVNKGSNTIRNIGGEVCLNTDGTCIPV